ncbi:MAG: TIGR01777 family oxidoreductase [Deferrisomatales bacterium]
MKVFVTGGTGFVGARLVPGLLEAGHQVVLLVRPAEAGRAVPGGDGVRVVVGESTRPGPWWDAVGACGAAVNLAGYPVFGRWTPKVKGLLRESRLETTRNLVRAIPGGGPFSLVSASGIGIFGDAGEAELDESSPPGRDFLSRLAADWEAEAFAARDQGARVTTTRFGIVLGHDGGALPQFVRNARWFLNGPLGSGRQWMSWIHREDVVRGILFLLAGEGLEGPFNFVSPGPVRQLEFARALGRELGRPAVVPTPALALRLLQGEFGWVSLFSQNARPRKLQEAGFAFRYPDLGSALAEALPRLLEARP